MVISKRYRDYVKKCGWELSDTKKYGMCDLCDRLYIEGYYTPYQRKREIMNWAGEIPGDDETVNAELCTKHAQELGLIW